MLYSGEATKMAREITKAFLSIWVADATPPLPTICSSSTVMSTTPDLTLHDAIVNDLFAVGTFRLKEKPKTTRPIKSRTR